MKRFYLSALTALFLLTGCTSNKPASDTEENNEPQEMEIEEEFDVQTEEGEVGGGL